MTTKRSDVATVVIYNHALEFTVIVQKIYDSNFIIMEKK